MVEARGSCNGDLMVRGKQLLSVRAEASDVSRARNKVLGQG